MKEFKQLSQWSACGELIFDAASKLNVDPVVFRNPKQRHLAKAQNRVMYLMHTVLGLNEIEIGSLFFDLDYAAVKYRVQRAATLCS